MTTVAELTIPSTLRERSSLAPNGKAKYAIRPLSIRNAPGIERALPVQVQTGDSPPSMQRNSDCQLVSPRRGSPHTVAIKYVGRLNRRSRNGNSGCRLCAVKGKDVNRTGVCRTVDNRLDSSHFPLNGNSRVGDGGRVGSAKPLSGCCRSLRRRQFRRGPQSTAFLHVRRIVSFSLGLLYARRVIEVDYKFAILCTKSLGDMSVS